MSTIEPGEVVTILVDGQAVPARKGQSIAAALLTAGRRVLRHTRIDGRPRGLYCGMGVCFDCIARIDGVVDRTCMRRVEDGMQVESLGCFGSLRERRLEPGVSSLTPDPEGSGERRVPADAGRFRGKP